MGQRNTRFYADIMELHSGVTGSGHLVAVRLPDKSTIKFLIDCGLFQEPGCEELNKDFPFKPEELDFVCLTHDHADHTGRLPMLYAKGYANAIYCTEQTQSLLRISLEDNYKIMKENAKKKKEEIFYQEKNVYEALQRVVTCQYGQAISVHPNVDIKFLSNGHLLGAAMILVRIYYPGEPDIFILFTGDYKPYNIFYGVEELIPWIKKLPLTVVTEATYGDTYCDQIHKCFQENIVKALQTRYQTIVIPVFAKGRAQEILYELKQMQKNGLLSYAVPIYYDGPTSHRYTAVYRKHPQWFYPEMRDFLPANLHDVTSSEERAFAIADNQVKIIVTTGGMLSNGPIRVYLPIYLPRKDTYFHLTGYCAEGTLGRSLLETPDGEQITLLGRTIAKKATIEQTNEFSGHGKADELLDLLQSLENVYTILINHGEETVKEKFKQTIMEKMKVSHGVEVLDRSKVYRITPYGLSKMFNSNFDKKKV